MLCRLLLPLVLTVAMTGCANQSMYQWGGYDALLYQSYKSPDKVVAFRQGLELHIGKMEQTKQKVAPGLYAELGTLYLQAGDSTNAAVMYARERDTWPESGELMNSLINNVTKRAVTVPAASK